MSEENNLECLNCDSYHYCTRDSCILDINDEKQDFEYTDGKGIEF